MKKTMKTTRNTLLLAGGILSAAVAVATEPAAPPHHTLVTPTTLQWGPAPPVLPAGAKLAVLQGDPGAAGEFTLRLAMPDGYRIPPHWHPTDENVTVIQGTFHAGMGETFDKAKGSALPAGGFASLPAKMPHYAWAEGETVVQVHGMGPFALTYVNPADDPRPPAKTP